jgi:tripeptide aminopeptidase
MSATTDHAERELLDDVIALARIPAPTFAEEARLSWIERRLEKAPGQHRRDGVGNVLWTWGEGRTRLLITAHVDTVFPADTPLEITRDGRFLTGPGVGDNAAAIATTIAVVEDLLSRNDLATGAVAFTVCEEGLGNLRGVSAALDELMPQAVVALEGHGLEHVIADAIGSVRARITIRGPGGHPWIDRDRPSAIHGLLELGAALVAIPHESTSVNVGLLSGGRSINTIAEEAELLLEARAINGSALDAMVAKCERLTAPDSLELVVEFVGRRPAGRLPRDSDLLRVVLAIREELRLPTTIEGGSTDANAALARGIPAIALGVAIGSNMHTAAERIEIDSLRAGRRQLECLVRRILAPAQAER